MVHLSHPSFFNTTIFPLSSHNKFFFYHSIFLFTIFPSLRFFPTSSVFPRLSNPSFFSYRFFSQIWLFPHVLSLPGLFPLDTSPQTSVFCYDVPPLLGFRIHFFVSPLGRFLTKDFPLRSSPTHKTQSVVSNVIFILFVDASQNHCRGVEKQC